MHRISLAKFRTASVLLGQFAIERISLNYLDCEVQHLLAPHIRLGN